MSAGEARSAAQPRDDSFGEETTRAAKTPDLQPEYAKSSWASEVEQLERRIDQLEDALRYLYMWISPAQLNEDEDTALVEARRICWEALQMARCEFEPETFWLNLTEALTYDCPKCGDGDALLADEACAYCGLVKGPDGEAEC